MPSFPHDLHEEIDTRLEAFAENPDWDETSLFLNTYQATRDIEDADECPQSWVTQMRRWWIQLGCYLEMTEEDLANTVVTRGKKYEFQIRGRKYQFDRHPTGFQT